MGEETDKIIRDLSEFITLRRKELFARVIENRTRYLTVVLEDIYKPQNASAVLRTCECFGIQDVHIIENRNTYTLNPDVVLGADKWLNLFKYRDKANNTRDAIKSIRKSGYRLVATAPGEGSIALEEFCLEKGKAALFFGTELTGLTEYVLDQADECLRIPIFGFTESYNISVSAAIILHHLTYRLRKSRINWKLVKSERDEILLEWLKKSVHPSGPN